MREEEFLDALPDLKGKVSERAILRAAHFFAENRRTDGAADALLRGDVSAFLRLLRESGESSQKYLQNCFVPGSDVQPVNLALWLSSRLLKEGGYRLHGGGFAGTVLACVREEEREGYVREMSRVFGKENVFRARVRDSGTAEVGLGG